MPDNAMLFVHALTGLHPGSGTALGVVDLPVQRERHTQWPTIPGSSLKGVLREACRREAGDGEDGMNELYAAFGPDTAHSSEHAGALAITDARILAFPVRSLRGVFAWVTCPAALQRLQRDWGIVDGNGRDLPEIPALASNSAACGNDSPLIAGEDRLILEEFEFARTGGCDDVAAWIAARAIAEPATADRLRTHLAVLHDDDFTHFVRHATEVLARVGLDYELKTVRKGALFYEEFLPPETLFYSVIMAGDSRRSDVQRDAADMLRFLRDRTPAVLQIGADETIGKGLCALNFAT